MEKSNQAQKKPSARKEGMPNQEPPKVQLVRAESRNRQESACCPSGDCGFFMY